jgi:hypothetical protein
MISPGNVVSARTAAKLGYGLMRGAEYKGEPVNLYVRD